ncbi:MAG: hypothetical protein AAB408_04705, partial [Patescibacteria group bacterium]
LKAWGASGVDVGCANADLEALLAGYFNVDFKSIMGYLQSNAGAFLLTLLIYSNPTLYSLLQDLKNAGDFALNANMLNCSTIRKIADNSRTQAITKEALDECSKYSPGVSEEKMRTGECVKNAVELRKKRMEGKQLAGLGGNDVSVNKYLLDSVDMSDEMKQLIGAMVPDETYNGGDTRKTSPAETVTNSYTKSYDKQLVRLKAITAQVYNAKKAGKPIDIPSIKELKELNSQEGVEPMPTYLFDALMRYNPDDREVIINRLAHKQALGITRAKIRKVGEVIQAALLKGDKTVEMHDYQRRDTKEAIEILNVMNNQLELEFKMLEAQENMFSGIMSNAPPASGLR